MQFGLKESVLDRINQVFQSFPKVEKVILYGSRAKGTHAYNSDIDLTILGHDLNWSDLAKIDQALDDLLLPYQMDLSIFSEIENPDLIDHIQRIGQPLFERHLANQ